MWNYNIPSIKGKQHSLLKLPCTTWVQILAHIFYANYTTSEYDQIYVVCPQSGIIFKCGGNVSVWTKFEKAQALSSAVL